MQEDEPNFACVIPVEYLWHTPGHPFCYDPTCGCHDDQRFIAEVATFVSDGLMTPEEATDFVAGKMI